MQQLIQAAKDIIEKRYDKRRHTVGATLRAKSGNVYTGVCLNSQKLDLCSEWGLVSQAFSQGDGEIEMVVAVHRDQEGNYEIYPPCALCRELFLTYCPDAQVILSETESVKASELLPRAWVKR
ncbi:MAG: cytidine deaminase [bacterium]